MKPICTMILVIFGVTVSYGQKELTAGGHYLIPLSDVDPYDDALNYRISYGTLKKKRKKRLVYLGGYYLGYIHQQPIADTLFYQYSANELGYYVYSDKHTIQAGGIFRWYLPLSDDFEMLFGSDIGYSIEFFSSTHRYPGLHATESGAESKGQLSPHLGGRYSISESFGIFGRGAFNLLFDIGTGDPTFTTSLTFGAGLSIRLN